MKKIINYQILKRIDNRDFDSNKELYISNAIIDTIDFRFTSFIYPVRINNCIIGNLLIHSSSFEGGFMLENCVIKESTDYEMGGHNKQPFIIQNNIFINRIQFFDCLFEQQVIIRNNVFCQSASLFNGTNSFDNSYIVETNQGNLDLPICL